MTFLKAETHLKLKDIDNIILNPATTVATIQGLEHSVYKIPFAKAMIRVSEAVAFLAELEREQRGKVRNGICNKKR